MHLASLRVVIWWFVHSYCGNICFVYREGSVIVDILEGKTLRFGRSWLVHEATVVPLFVFVAYKFEEVLKGWESTIVLFFVS